MEHVRSFHHAYVFLAFCSLCFLSIFLSGYCVDLSYSSWPSCCCGVPLLFSHHHILDSVAFSFSIIPIDSLLVQFFGEISIVCLLLNIQTLGSNFLHISTSEAGMLLPSEWLGLDVPQCLHGTDSVAWLQLATGLTCRGTWVLIVKCQW